MLSKIISFLIFIAFAFFFFESDVLSAEVLQVSSPSVLLIGDNNRNYTVKISCLDIYPDHENELKDWLKIQLPRHTKINLRPKGIDKGVLLAKVFPLGSEIDLSKKIEDQGFGRSIC